MDLDLMLYLLADYVSQAGVCFTWMADSATGRRTVASGTGKTR